MNWSEDLANRIAKRICPFIEFKSGGEVEEKFMSNIVNEEIEKFENERIVRIYLIEGK